MTPHLAAPWLGRSEERGLPDEVEPAGGLDVVVAERAVPALVAAAHPARIVRHRGEDLKPRFRNITARKAPVTTQHRAPLHRSHDAAQ